MMKTILPVTFLIASIASASLPAAPPARDNGAEHYQVRFALLFEEGTIGTAYETMPAEAIPAGMQLVVSNVNYGIRLPSAQTGACQLVDADGWSLLYLPVPATWSGNGVGERLGFGNERTELVIGEGNFVVGCERSAPTGLGSATIIVTGSLIELE